MEGGEATHLLRGASATHRELLQAQASLMRRTGSQSTIFFDPFLFAIQNWMPRSCFRIWIVVTKYFVLQFFGCLALFTHFVFVYGCRSGALLLIIMRAYSLPSAILFS